MDLDFDFFTVVTSDLYEENSLVLLSKKQTSKTEQITSSIKVKFHLEIELTEVIGFRSFLFTT